MWSIRNWDIRAKSKDAHREARASFAGNGGRYEGNGQFKIGRPKGERRESDGKTKFRVKCKL
jgi:hypothetical protein